MKTGLDLTIVNDFSLLYNLYMGRHPVEHIKHNCLNCFCDFYVLPCIDKLGFGKYCSDKCRRRYDSLHKLSRKVIWSKFNKSDKGKEYSRSWHRIKAFGY